MTMKNVKIWMVPVALVYWMAVIPVKTVEWMVAHFNVFVLMFVLLLFFLF